MFDGGGLVSLDSHRKRQLSTDKTINVEEPPITSQNFGSIPNLEHLNPDDWTWSSSNQLSLHDVKFINSKTAFFHPQYSYGTAAVIGERKLTEDVVAYWEIQVKFVYGTSMMFGIGSKCSKLVSPILFENLIGGDSNSYGLSHKGIIHHNAETSKYCDPFKERKSAVVGVYFNGPKHELSYFIDGKYKGVAFNNLDLNNSVYYPMISSTSQKSHFSVNQQKYLAVVVPLAKQCLNKVAKLVQQGVLNDVDKLGLPPKLAKTLEDHLSHLSPKQQAITPSKRQKLDETDSMELEVDSLEPNPALLFELSENIKEQLMRLAWSQSISSQI